MDPGDRLALLVLGMHRSGTSALTRTLNLLGAELSENLLPAHADNEAGFWEHREVVILHDELLAALGTSWDDPRPIAESDLTGEVARPFRDRLREILERDFQTTNCFAIKDPRICRLLPLWLPLLDEMNVRPLCVLTGRHPDEVAASLDRRNEMPASSAQLLWMTHVLASEWHSRGCPRTFITFDGLMEDWRCEMRRLMADLELDWEPAIHRAGDEIDAFLDPALQHHASADDDPAGGPWIERTWSAFRAGARGETERAAVALDRVSRELGVAGELFFPMVGAGNQWRQKAEARRGQVLELRRRLAEGDEVTPATTAPDSADTAPEQSTTASPETDATQVVAEATEIRRDAMPTGTLGRAGTEVLRTYDVPEGTPTVSIVIPLFNHVELTKMCLESLAEYTDDGTYEVILVDNGSTDATLDLLGCLEGNVKIIRNETNLGFATACNQGAELASTPNLLFLNNDIEAKSNWLPPLLDLLESDPSIGIAGSKLLFPDGTIQHAGVALLGREQHQILLGAFHMHYGEPGDCAEAAEAMRLQVVTGACLMVRRAIFEELGGFDTYFWNGCEDVDFCLKVGAKGWKVVYEPTSVLVHHESMSGPQRFSRTKSNENLLASRWYGKVEPDLIERADGTRVLAVGTPMAPYLSPDRLREDAAPAPASPDALTSILVLTRNGLEDTKLCLDSIAAHTKEPHEVIVVDNASTDGTIEYLRERLEIAGNLRVVQNASNRGFAAGNNIGLSIAHGAQIVLLNNDTVVTPGWLGGLSAVLHEHADCGIVGPMTNYASGPQLLSEVPYKTLEKMNEFALDWACDHEGSEPARRLVAFCWMMRREVVDELGGLDERFGTGNCEDDDYCLRVFQAGWKTRIAKGVFIHHTGSRTFRAEKIDYAALMRENFEIFRKKWGLGPEATVEKPYSFLEMVKGPAQPRIQLPEVAATHGLQDRGRWHRDRQLGETSPVDTRTPDTETGALDDSTYRLAVGLLPGDELTAETRALFTSYGFEGEPPVWETTSHITEQLPEKPLLLMLGPDVVVPDDALREMLEVMKADPNVAAVGPVSNAAPSAQRDKPHYRDVGRELRRFAARRRRKSGGKTRSVAHLGGFCLLLKSALVRQVGGLDDSLPIEEALLDLFGRLHEADHGVVVASGAWVHHVRLTDVEGAAYGHRPSAAAV